MTRREKQQRHDEQKTKRRDDDVINLISRKREEGKAKRRAHEAERRKYILCVLQSIVGVLWLLIDTVLSDHFLPHPPSFPSHRLFISRKNPAHPLPLSSFSTFHPRFSFLLLFLLLLLLLSSFSLPSSSQIYSPLFTPPCFSG